MTTSFESALAADAPATSATAFGVVVDGWAHGRIGLAGDADFIAVDLVAGQDYTFAMVGIGADALTDSLLRLFGPNGATQLAMDGNGLANGHAILRFTALITGRHFLQASAGTASVVGDYAVSATTGDMAVFDAPMIAGILDSHSDWTASRGSGATLTFGFAETNLHALPGFSTFTEGQKDTTRAVLALFSDVAGLSFTEVNPGGLTNQATLLYGNYADQGGPAAQTGPPGTLGFTSQSGDIWLNTTAPPTEAPQHSSSYFHLMLQQVGLAMGLSHPGTGGTFGVDGDFVQNSTQFTVMSLFGAGETGASPLYADTLGIYDIRALQVIYGANATTRLGADTYGFGATAGAVYDFDVNIDPMVTIWDGGGTDRLDLARYSAGQTVSLIPGTYSSIGGFVQNLGIAFGTVIERVTGGRGSDDITGNGVANLLEGGGGADILRGGAGRDTLCGGAGGDTLYGGTGNDVLWGDDLGGGIANPAVNINLVTTNDAQNAQLAATDLDLFPTQSFTLEMIWQQRALTQPGEALRFGNLSLHRHADGSGSIRFAGAETEEWLTGILPSGLGDGAAHRLSITYDDIDGRLVVYLDGVRRAEHVFPTTTRGLTTNGDIMLGDHAALGDLRIFDTARSAQEIWDLAWTPLPDPVNTPGLLHYWQGNGSGSLLNYLPGLPDLIGSGPVGNTGALFGDSLAGNRLAGGSGDDVYHVLHANDVVIEGQGAGLDQVLAHVDFTLGAGQAVERLTVATASGGVVLIGNALANHLTSAADAADTLHGGAGNDRYTLYHVADKVVEVSGGGWDVIYSHVNHSLVTGSTVEELRGVGSLGLRLNGNALNNRILGAAGADTLEGGLGQDRLWGGDATVRDVFVFRGLSHSAVGLSRDVIHDFVSGIDRIDLRGIDANGTLPGNQAFGFSPNGPLAFGVWLVASASGLVLRADATGDGRADLEIGLPGLAGLIKSDLWL